MCGSYMLQRTKFQHILLQRTKQPILVWNSRDTSELSLFSRQLEFHSHGDNMSRNWMRLTHDAVMLGLEAQRVIGLRLIKLSSGGPTAQAEAWRMVSEKTAALAEAGLTLARGGSAGSVIRRYRTHVRSNKRRLLKS
jgi:hypothetical protein